MYFWICVSALLLVFMNSQALESNSSLYQSDRPSVYSTSSCGDFCKTNQNYYDQFQFSQVRAQRGFDPVAVTKPFSQANRNRQSFNQSFMVLSFDSESALSRFVIERQIRWSMMARDIGIQVSEFDTTLSSAIWREIRRPLLFELRDRLLSPYRGKKLAIKEKLQAWLLEQTVESGAGTLGLNASQSDGVEPNSLDFGVSDYRLKFRPKIDPLKGRYGIRLKYKKHLDSSRPLVAQLSAYYCNSSTGFRKESVCGYHHELSGRVSMSSLSRKFWYSMFVSYQTESLNDRAYINNGQAYDYKPWLAGVQMTYAFYNY